MKLPEPDCVLGYTWEQLRDVYGVHIHGLAEWMRGQSQTYCDGLTYNHDTREYEFTNCGPHGPVVYPWDLKNYLEGGEPLD